jgi:hypothetical protein
MKEGSLFCFVCTYAIHQIGMLQIMLVSLESSWRGLHGLGSMAFGLGVQTFLNNEWFLHFKLNCSWKFQRNWNMPLVLLERSWWTGFNEIYLVRFGFRMWENSDFCHSKFPKNWVLKGKISWGRGNTWANGIGHTSFCHVEQSTFSRYKEASLQTSFTHDMHFNAPMAWLSKWLIVICNNTHHTFFTWKWCDLKQYPTFSVDEWRQEP